MLKYKPAHLHKTERYWYVDYYIQHPVTKEYERFIEKKGLNKKGTPIAERKQAAANLVSSINEMLRAGEIDPWGLGDIEEATSMDISIAFKQAYNSKCLSLSKRSKNDYSVTYNRFNEALLKLGWHHLPAAKFTRKYAIQALNSIKENTGCSDNRYNTHKQYLSAIFSEMVRIEIIENNPFYLIPDKKTKEPTVFDPPTDKEQKKIDEHLYKHFRPMFIFKSLILTVGVRPNELLSLRTEDVDFQEMNFTIWHESVKGGRKKKTLPLMAEIIPLLSEHLQSEKKYVFGKNLLPGDKIISRNTLSRYWLLNVIKKLKINKKLYSNKKYGADKMIMAGIHVDYLREIFGHSSYLTTERYITQKRNKAHEVIRQKGPSILKNIEDI